jgi:thioredoxin-like negative regulator of GroEL
MSKRHQINIALDPTEMNNVNEYCRVHRMTPQSFFKAGAQRLIADDMLERAADIKTIQAMEDVWAGRSEPVDDLLEMIEEDSRNGRNSVVGNTGLINEHSG